MRRLIVLSLILAGCSHGGGSPTEITAPAPPGTEEGRQQVVQSGCLACHTLGDDGNDGPGQDLTKVGARLSRDELRRWLLEPEPPMPSYAQMPQDKQDAVVDYLAALR